MFTLLTVSVLRVVSGSALSVCVRQNVLSPIKRRALRRAATSMFADALQQRRCASVPMLVDAFQRPDDTFVYVFIAVRTLSDVFERVLSACRALKRFQSDSRTCTNTFQRNQNVLQTYSPQRESRQT